MSNTSATGGYLVPTSTPPADDDALDDILSDLIVGLTAFDPTLVRPRWQPTSPKMPDPSVNWCAIGVTEETPDANAVVTHDGAANGGLGQDNLQRNEEIRVLATFYGPNAKGYAKQVRDGLSIPQNFEALEIALLAVITTDTIRAVPELLNNQWVRRYDLPIRFRRLVMRSYAIQNILTAGVTVYDDNQTISINVAP